MKYDLISWTNYCIKFQVKKIEYSLCIQVLSPDKTQVSQALRRWLMWKNQKVWNTTEVVCGTHGRTTTDLRYIEVSAILSHIVFIPNKSKSFSSLFKTTAKVASLYLKEKLMYLSWYLKFALEVSFDDRLLLWINPCSGIATTII